MTDLVELSPIENTDTPIFGCSCPSCLAAADKYAPADEGAGGDFDNPITPGGLGLFELLDIHQAADGTYYFSGDRNVDAALIGSRWTPSNITYSFPTSGDVYGDNYDVGFSDRNQTLYHVEFNEMQKDAAEAAFALISSYTNLTFTEVDEETDGPAILRLSQTASPALPSAMGYFPGPLYLSGDIWFGINNQPYYETPEQGNWGYATMLHEIGHTMGLKHGHQDYTNEDLSDYFGGNGPRPGSRSQPTEHDGQAWTLMSYRSDPGVAGDPPFAGDQFNQPQTYMQNDIAALQFLYGANYTTNASDSTYTWSETTGEMSINGAGQGEANSPIIFQTIWDGGGHDTYDLSNYDDGVTVDLRPGAYSLFSVDQLANHRAFSSDIAWAPGNIANALLFGGNTASLIEDAIGGDGGDWLIGNQVANSLTGGQGDDVLEGREGNDTLEGGAGSDTAVFYSSTTGIAITLNEGVSDLVVVSDAGTDTLRSIENVVGGSGDDQLTGDTQDNLLDGGALGNDTLSGGDGDDTLIASGFVRTASDMADFTKLQGQVINDMVSAFTLTAPNFDTALDPDIGSSTTIPHATINAVAAGGGLEYYRLDVLAGDKATFDIDTFATQDIDTFIELVNAGGTVVASNDFGSSGDPGGFGNDDSLITFTFGTAGTYYLRVGQFLTGQATAQALTAGQEYTLNVSWNGGNVSTYTLDETGTGTLTGGNGDDLLVAGVGNDVIDGGADNDTVSYEQAFDGVTVNLANVGAQDTGTAGNDDISNVENLIGSGFNDTLTGDGSANVIEGGAGDDVMDGAGGRDTLTYVHAAAGVTVSLATAGAQATGGAGSDTVSNFEDLTGSGFNDSLTGDANDNSVSGSDGDDVLNGGGVAAGLDTLNGGNGIDVASFAGAAYASGVIGTLNGGADFTVTDSALTGVALLQSIEGLQGGDGNDTLTGDALANILRGGGGGDVLAGDAGNDIIEGGAGDDTIAGGLDVDTLVFTGATAITLNLNTLTAQATGYGTDTITGMENVVTGSGADNITGDGNDNVFYDNGGNDTYNGGGASDTIDYSSRTVAVNVNLGNAAAQNTGTGGGTETISNVENLVGTALNDTMLGTAAANRLIGGFGNDSATGNGGADYLEGGEGSDLLSGDSATATPGGDGNDTILGGGGIDLIIAGLGNDLVDAGLGNDVIIAGLGTGAFSAGVATATATLNAASGADTIDGGQGFDLVYMHYTGVAGAIEVDISDPHQTNNVELNGVTDSVLIDVERLIIRGAMGNDTITGGVSADQLFGREGNDSLSGGAENDTLGAGGGGDDTLNGGGGTDVASYADATSGVNVDLDVQDVAFNTVGDGVDFFHSIEGVLGGAGTDTLDGTSHWDIMGDSSGGNDTILSHGGNDTITVGRSGTMLSSGVLIDADTGNDTVTVTSANRTVATVLQVDTFTVNGGTGTDTISVTGNGVLSGVIDAGDGNDTITFGFGGLTGGGNYTLTGGAGSDTLTLNNNLNLTAYTVARNSVVTDFQAKAGGDRFEWTTFLNQAGGLTGYTANSNAFASGHARLTQSGADLILQVDRDGTGIANGFVNILTITNGASKGFTAFNFDNMVVNNLALVGTGAGETLAGSDGADTINSGGGNDLLEGGLGNDTLAGGSENDTVTYEYATAAVTVDLGAVGSQNTVGWGSDDLQDIEHLIGSGFNDVLTGKSGFNLIQGLAGNDELSGADGNDRLLGGDGNDTLKGGADDDRMDGGENSDTVSYAGLLANLTVDLAAGTATGEGSDTLIKIEHVVGGDGDDVIAGSNKANMLNGGAGADALTGLNGADILQGGAGLDTLTGGRGADILTGGSEIDVFFFDDLDSITDRITDLEASDVIDLSLIDANLNKPGNPGFTLVSSFTNHRGEATLTYDLGTDTTTLAMDRNGDGAADLSIEMDGDHDDHASWVGLTI